MKNKLIKLFPWSVALLFFGTTMFYNHLWNKAIDRNDRYSDLVDTSISIIKNYRHKYDSVVSLIPSVSGNALIYFDNSDGVKKGKLDSIIILHNYSDSELRGEKVFTQSESQ